MAREARHQQNDVPGRVRFDYMQEQGVDIRRAIDQDWPSIYPIYAANMAEGET